MDAVIAGIVIVVVTGVFVAVVRALSQKPKSVAPRPDEGDILGAHILGRELHDAFGGGGGSSAADGDLLDH